MPIPRVIQRPVSMDEPELSPWRIAHLQQQSGSLKMGHDFLQGDTQSRLGVAIMVVVQLDLAQAVECQACQGRKMLVAVMRRVKPRVHGPQSITPEALALQLFVLGM